MRLPDQTQFWPLNIQRWIRNGPCLQWTHSWVRETNTGIRYQRKVWKLILIGMVEFGTEFCENMKKEMVLKMTVTRWERIIRAEKKRTRITGEGNRPGLQSRAPREQLQRLILVRSWGLRGRKKELRLCPISQEEPWREQREWQRPIYILERRCRWTETAVWGCEGHRQQEGRGLLQSPT